MNFAKTAAPGAKKMALLGWVWCVWVGIDISPGFQAGEQLATPRLIENLSAKLARDGTADAGGAQSRPCFLSLTPVVSEEERASEMQITTQRYQGLVWSNSSAPEEVLIRAALLRPRFHTILSMVADVGFGRVSQEWEALVTENTREVQLAAGATSRILRNIRIGIFNAQARNRKTLELPQNV